MPRPKKAAAAAAAAAPAEAPPATGSSSKGKLGKELGKLLAARAAYMDEEDDESIHGGEPYYTGGFGTRRGTVCHCARCLRRSGPVTDDPGQVVDDIVTFLADTDIDGSVTNYEGSLDGGLEEHHTLLAETISLAVERGDANVLRTIMDNILDIEVQHELATRLAIPVAQHGHAHMIFLLDEYEADFEAPDPSRGGPPLMHAANNGHVAAVNALLECGADPEASDYNSQTALMVAIFSDRASAAEALLSGGAMVDSEDEKGRTALCHAARYGSLDCINVLAQHQANAFHTDRDGRTPIDIAEDCSRTEAATQIKRLQQRQRLRERKESRQKEADAGGTLNRQELVRREAEALKNALALLEEEESESQRKAETARKQKAKKDRRKGKAGVRPAQDNPAASTVPDQEQLHDSAEHRANGWTVTAEPAHSEAGPVSGGKTARPGHKAKAAPSLDEPSENSSSPGKPASSGKEDNPPRQSGTPEAEASTSKEASNGREAAPVDPVAELRQSWDTLLEEAASCRDPDRQAALLAEVQSMSVKCAAAGISVKYGKKVLSKLERVAPVRKALAAGMSEDVGDRESLEAALEQARGVKSLLDARLLADAEERLRQLNLQHSREQRQQEAAAAAAQSPVRLPTATLMPRHSPAQHHPQPPPAALDHRRAPPPPQPIQPAVASETQQRLDRLRAMVARSSPPQKPLPATLARPSPAGAATRIPGSAHQQRARSPQPLANGYQPPTAPANDSRVPAAASRLGNGPTLSHSQPSSMLTFGGPLQQQAQGRVHVQPAAERLPQSVGSLGSSDATDFGALFPTAATTHMHNQGLANIWQQQPATKPDAVTKSSSGFFSGSLFEMPLPSSQQMPAPPRQHGMGMPPPASLFGNASQNGSLRPVGSDRQSSGPGNNDWLQELLGSVSLDAHLGNGRRHMPAAERPPGRGASPQQGWQPWLNGRPESPGLKMQQNGRISPANLHASFQAHKAQFQGQERMPDGRGPSDAARPLGSLRMEGASAVAPRWEAPSHQPLAAEDECVVCMAAAHDCICIPCGHRAMCGPCASAVVQHTGLCPICRSPVERTLQVPC